MKHIRTRVFRVTQAEFAALVGVAQASVSRWENGAAPSLTEMSSVRAAAKAKGVSWDDSLFFELPVEVAE